MDYPFTAIPKWFFPLVPELSEAELRIMMVVWNQTTGWQADANIFAYTFLQQHTGMTSRTAIYKGLKSLENRGVIKREVKRVNGQKIQIFPQSPILPVEGVTLGDSGVTLEDSQSPLRRLTESPKVTHQKNTRKNLNQESPTPEKLTSDQEESLALLVVAGLDSETSRRLILIAWKNGHDSKYISDLLGYVAGVNPNNPPGYIRRMIERNSGWIPTSKGAEAPTQLKQGINLSKWEHGGIHHNAVAHNCEICHPELIAQRLEQEARWAIEDQEAENAQI